MMGLAAAAPAEHLIQWPGLEEPLASKHYSGHVSLEAKPYSFPWSGKTPDLETHYWYAESERDPEHDPIILWIQGGPGGSSIGGSFLEMGPLRLDSRSTGTATYNKTGIPTPVRNPHTWTAFAGLLAVEYADIGFSECAGNCTWDDAKACNSLVDFLERFFLDLFPERRDRPVWIAGESYAGILVTLTAGIIDHRGAASPVVGGILHGNGAVGHFSGGADPSAWPDGFNTNDMPEDAKHHVDFFFRAGLVSEKLYVGVQAACSADWWRPSQSCVEAMYKMRDGMGNFEEHGTFWNVYDIYDTCVDMTQVRAARRSFASSGPGDCPPPEEPSRFCGGIAVAEQYMNLDAVRRAMHIPKGARSRWTWTQDLEWECSQDDEEAFATNFSHCQITDYRPMIRDLATRMPVLVYSGDVDAQLPHTATERWTSSLGFEESEAWQPWTVRGAYVGGYVTRYEHDFTYATVKGAGHMVPASRPEAAREMVQRFLETRHLAPTGRQIRHLV